MVLCLGEPPRRFLLMFFISFCCHLWIFFIPILVFDIIPHPSVSFYTHFIISAQPIAEWFVTLSFSTIPLSSHREHYRFEWAFFTHRHFFTLRSFTDIYDSTYVYQGFPGRRQFFLEIFRASYWSLKHRPGPSVCLIHSNPQKIYIQYVIFTA